MTGTAVFATLGDSSRAASTTTAAASARVIPIWTPDGSGLIAAYDTGRAYLWDIQPASLIKHACQVAGRQLTRAEWDEALPGRRYDPAC